MVARQRPGQAPGKVTVGAMQAADIEAVVDIEKLCFSTFWPVNAYINEMANRCAWYAVAKMGDRVVGYGGMWVIMDEAHITTLAVLPELRRQGLGLRLMDAMLREAIRRGARRSTLEVRRSNLAAITLYERLGYRGAAVRKAYYSDTREDALVMWAEGLHTEAYSLKLKEMLGEE